MDSMTSFLADHWILLAALSGSILLAAFFAASETALLFANKARLHQMVDEGHGSAAAALRLTRERDRLHSALLLVENFFLVLAVVLGTVTSLHLFGGLWTPLAATALIMTAVIVLIAKLAPKGIASRDPDGVALAVAYPMLFVMKALSPVARIVTAAAAFFAGPDAHRALSCTAVVTEEDIKAMITLGEEEGALKEEEKELLHKVFEFGDTLASEAMRPRTEIVSIPSTAAIQDLLAVMSEFGFSRYPVIEQNVDTVTGIIYMKDILIAMASGEISRDAPIAPYVRQAYFIPENKRVSELLAEMQRDKFQIAIVIDEFGGTAGLVTLEDLIEEIVGSIHDELDAEEKDVQIVDEKNIVVSGQSEMDEVNELLGTKLHSKEFNTIGGFLFGLFGRMPRVGEQLRYRDLKFEVLELDGRKIDKIKITKL
ncbi:MAG: hemolysin family protein [Nitrospiraceae bacterium]|nr:hemolysin family protein [Nitrospiraceae bacterium]